MQQFWEKRIIDREYTPLEMCYKRLIQWKPKVSQKAIDLMQEATHFYSMGAYGPAKTCYELLHSQGYVEATLMLATLAYLGQGQPQDMQEAYRLYLEASLKGNAEAQAHLGHMLLNGKGCEASEEEAMLWFEKSASQNYLEAMSVYGRFLVEKGDLKGLDLIQEAANKGHADAQLFLGTLFYIGKPIKDDIKAVEWLMKSAEQNQSDAQTALATCYLHGEGVGQDFVKANEWLMKASALGNQKARRMLTKMSNPASRKQSRV